MEPQSAHRLPRQWREWSLLLALLLPLAFVLPLGPIPQDLAYHAFADERALMGVPNFFNIASNIPFLLVGAAGVLFCLQTSGNGASPSWTVFFLGTALVFFGSSYYHSAPGNETLVWDRLPMTLGFMGLLSALLSEHVGEKLERVLLVPAIVVGIASVAWWDYTDDLRVYIWVQATPLLLVPLALAIYPGRYTHRRYLLYGLAAYVLAKAAEFYDREIFTLTAQVVSGHSLKHLLAALAIFFVYLMLRRRQPLAGRAPAG